MGKILCIETATTNCSVAMGQDGNLLGLIENNEKQYSHAEELHVFIAAILKKSSVDLKELDAIAISKGPGSYTGLRIGVSAAKGLCFALDIPLISIPTLASLARQVDCEKEEVVVPMLDARRMEVYSAVFDADGKQIRKTQAEILDEHSFENYLKKGNVHFIGDGVEKFKKIKKSPHAIFEEKLPSSKQMISMAETKFQNKEWEDVAYFEPYYLKDFVGGKRGKL